MGVMRELLLIISLTFCTAFGAPLPDLGSHNGLLSQHEAQKMGREFMQQVRAHLPLNHNPLVTAYIQRLGNQLVAHTSAKGTPFHFFVVDDPEINAFAGPGGYIGINAGLITKTQSEAELASVLAHEIAHVTQHHIMRMISQQKMQRIPTALIALAGLASGSGAGAGAIVSAAAASQSAMLSFSRGFEQEADRVGMNTLYQSGYDPKAMPAFFKRMRDASRFYPTPPPFLSSHPMDGSRIAESLDRANQLQQDNIKQNSFEYPFIKTLLTLQNSQTPRELLSQYKKAGDPLQQYGYALLLLKLNRFDDASHVLFKLHTAYPSNLFYVMALANLNLMRHQPGKAVQHLAAFKDNPIVTARYAQALLENGEARKAITPLTHLVQKHPTDPSVYAALAHAESQAGLQAEAYFHQGIAYALLNKHAQAKTLWQHALQQKDISPDLRAQINSKLDPTDNTL